MKKLFAAFALFTGLFVTGCSSNSVDGAEQNTVKLGVVGENNEPWEAVQETLADEGINLEIVTFTDYNQPNAALAAGEIDINAFQTQIFLDNFNTEAGANIVSIAKTIIAPLGIYSDKVSDVSELEEGAKISIPNDITNGGRALLLLQSAGLITVDPAAGQIPTVEDITENKRNLNITEIDAAQTARSLQDVDAAVINSGMAVEAGLVPTEDAIFLEPINESSEPYFNVIAVNEEEKDNETYLKVVEAYQTDEIKEIIEEVYQGAFIPVWE